MSTYHQPVMLAECLAGLKINPKGTYLDLTLGGGGHSRAILDHLSTEGQLYALDQDQDAIEEGKNIASENLTLIEANFRFFAQYLKLYQIQQVDGILADLGVSSHQIDTAQRGFSTRFQGQLDMRMDQKASKNAQQVINEYSEADLHRILGLYGEVRNAKTLAQAIVRERVNQNIDTVEDLKNICLPYAPRHREHKYLAQIFQAIRIEVNDELKALEEMLIQSAEVLQTGGRLVILSYHSLEDRLVKNFIQKGKFQGEIEKDLYGNPLNVPFQAVHRKPLTASAEEIQTNKRARSAKLRVAVRK